MNWPISYINRKYEELSYPQKSDNVRHRSSNQSKMRPHFSQSSRENATPIQRHIPISLL